MICGEAQRSSSGTEDDKQAREPGRSRDEGLVKPRGRGWSIGARAILKMLKILRMGGTCMKCLSLDSWDVEMGHVSHRANEGDIKEKGRGRICRLLQVLQVQLGAAVGSDGLMVTGRNWTLDDFLASRIFRSCASWKSAAYFHPSSAPFFSFFSPSHLSHLTYVVKFGYFPSWRSTLLYRAGSYNL
jgi:hypothetical protein